MHAEMWVDRLLAGRRAARGWTRRSTSSGRTRSACWTTTCARSSAAASRRSSAERCLTTSPYPRGRHEAELEELLDEMTMVRRSAPAGAQW